jgi:hypothetical protein
LGCIDPSTLELVRAIYLRLIGGSADLFQSGRGGTQYAWGSAAVIAPLIIGIALLVFFMFYEWKVAVLPL